MKPPTFVRPLTDHERQALKAALRSPDAFTLRRCQILLASADGQRAPQIARTLGCELRDDGSITVDASQETTVERIYAAGNCTDPRALVPASAGSGVTAAVAINARLSLDDADQAVADLGARSPAARVR